MHILDKESEEVYVMTAVVLPMVPLALNAVDLFRTLQVS